MTIQEMKRKKQEKGYTYAQIAELSGVPLGTVQKIFCGETTSPRYDTLLALETLFTEKLEVRDPNVYQTEIHTQGSYTIADYYKLPDEERVELIDGYFYNMSAPTLYHQIYAGDIYRQISNYIMQKGGDCIPFISPVDVQLDCDERTMVQPDVALLCDRDKMTRRVIYGAPDFVLEVISPSTRRKDYTKKLSKYMEAGVREYWILDTYQKKLLVYFFESEVCPVIYGLEQPVPIGIFDGELKIEFSNIVKWVEEDEE